MSRSHDSTPEDGHAPDGRHDRARQRPTGAPYPQHPWPESLRNATRRTERTVLFLCTGNYYRSRFAELLFNALAAARRLPWRAESAGLALERGIHNVGPIAATALAALEALGHAPPEEHRFPQPVREADLARADLVIALKRAEHHPLLRERFGGWEDRVVYWHVHDTDQAPPQQALAEIEQLVRDLLEVLATAA